MCDFSCTNISFDGDFFNLCDFYNFTHFLIQEGVNPETISAENLRSSIYNIIKLYHFHFIFISSTFNLSNIQDSIFMFLNSL